MHGQSDNLLFKPRLHTLIQRPFERSYGGNQSFINLVFTFGYSCLRPSYHITKFRFQLDTIASYLLSYLQIRGLSTAKKNVEVAVK